MSEKKIDLSGLLPMSRREAMTALAALPAAWGIVPVQAAQILGKPAEIAPGVFVHTGPHDIASKDNHGDISNWSFIVGNQSVAVIDTGGGEIVGREIRKQVRGVTDKPITHVINTHMHPDHVLGNVAFLDLSPAYVGHHKLRRALEARGERYLERYRETVGPDVAGQTSIVMPTIEVKDRLQIDLGGRILQLDARPTAHTDNDLTIFDQQTGTLFLGDLLFSGHVPTLDGSIRGWLKLLAKLPEEKANRVVPGHGPASMNWPEALQPVARYLDAIAADVRRDIAAGKPLTDSLETAAIAERHAWQLFDEFHKRNVTAAFAELEWE